MNKIAKASIAGAAGVVLLMGGAGSLAYWNSTANLGSNGTTITAGTLSATAGVGSWTSSFNGGASAAGLPALLVPGNRLTYTQTFTVSATGDNLLFSVGVTTPTLDGTNKLAAKLVQTGVVSVQKSDGTVLTPNGNGSYTAAQGVAKIVVTQTFTWGFGTAPSSNTAGDNDAQGVSYTLPTSGVVTLTQTAS